MDALEQLIAIKRTHYQEGKIGEVDQLAELREEVRLLRVSSSIRLMKAIQENRVRGQMAACLHTLHMKQHHAKQVRESFTAFNAQMAAIRTQQKRALQKAKEAAVEEAEAEWEIQQEAIELADRNKLASAVKTAIAQTKIEMAAANTEREQMIETEREAKQFWKKEAEEAKEALSTMAVTTAVGMQTISSNMRKASIRQLMRSLWRIRRMDMSAAWIVFRLNHQKDVLETSFVLHMKVAAQRYRSEAKSKQRTCFGVGPPEEERRCRVY